MGKYGKTEHNLVGGMVSGNSAAGKKLVKSKWILGVSQQHGTSILSPISTNAWWPGEGYQQGKLHGGCAGAMSEPFWDLQGFPKKLNYKIKILKGHAGWPFCELLLRLSSAPAGNCHLCRISIMGLSHQSSFSPEVWVGVYHISRGWFPPAKKCWGESRVSPGESSVIRRGIRKLMVCVWLLTVGQALHKDLDVPCPI